MSSAAVYPPTSGPSTSMYGNVPGYEGTLAGGGGYLPPPVPVEPVAPPQPGPAPDNWSIPSLSEDVAREAFKSFASSQCCYSKAPASDGVITNMEAFNTYRSEESYGETPCSYPFKNCGCDRYLCSGSPLVVVRLPNSTLYSSHKTFERWGIILLWSTTKQTLHTRRYRLETFTESRSTELANKPYEGEQADFYAQPAPRPWEVMATPPNLFTNHTEEIRVPYTSSVQDCSKCHATGTVECEQCNGSGYDEQCWVCNGSGTSNDQSCSHCDGKGRERCKSCSGQRMKECETCKGKRQLLTYIKLKVEWINHVGDHVENQTSGLNPDNLRSVHGKKLFEDSQYLVYPLIGFPLQAISLASEHLVREHQSKYAQNSRILQQRQTVELVPITKVKYNWKSSSHVYYVFGNENQVNAENYPATCCCVIL
ncbi:Protein SSUH2 -like protein [Takifugu flavidus]|uniref:Protein SSUH2-like protein n=1 Tax=Takifugu flavidus TaxID=433684 RepID=A0A5C6NAP9_9TELE|nr:Protein SSUH2 -like protein [Takifugu flavidus]